MALSGCANNSNEENNSISPVLPADGIYFSFYYYKTDLVWKLTRDSYLSQCEKAEKDDQFNFTAEVIYSYGETASEFLNGEDEITLTFPKSNYAFDNIKPQISHDYYYVLDSLDNINSIFEKYDYILMCEYDLQETINIENNGTLIIHHTFSTPYAFIGNNSCGKDCYDAYLLFYGDYVPTDLKKSEYSYFGHNTPITETEDDKNWLKAKEEKSYSEEKIISFINNSNQRFSN